MGRVGLFDLVHLLRSSGFGGLEVLLLSGGVGWRLGEAWVLAPTRRWAPKEVERFLEGELTPSLPPWLSSWGDSLLPFGGEIWFRLDLEGGRVRVRVTPYVGLSWERLALFPWRLLEGFPREAFSPHGREKDLLMPFVLLSGGGDPPEGLWVCREGWGWNPPLGGKEPLWGSLEGWLGERGVPVLPRMRGGLEVSTCLACREEGLEVLERRVGLQPLGSQFWTLSLESLLLKELVCTLVPD